MSTPYKITSEPNQPLTFCIHDPLPVGAIRKAIPLSDLLDKLDQEGNRECVMAEAEKRFLDATTGLFWASEVGNWVAKSGAEVSLEGRHLFHKNESLLLTFKEPRDAMMFKLTWV